MNGKILILAGALLFAGCAKITPQKTQPISFTLISPQLRISDAGFIRNFKNQTEVQVYTSGVSVLSLVSKDGKVCMNSACDNEITFNQKFFKNDHYNGFLTEILSGNKIYSGRDLAKTDCGFEQNFGEISYSVCENSEKSVNFADLKSGIKIKLRELQ